MPQTALKVNDKKIVFITQQMDTFLQIEIYVADDEYQAIGKPELGVHGDEEETWHRNFRKEASEKGHYVPQFSTNPEWNPEKDTE